MANKFVKLVNADAFRFQKGHLTALGNAMLDGTRGFGGSLDSGYVYLGQFITHDITRLARGDDEPGPPGVHVSQLQQLRNPALDLDSVYGDGFDDEISMVDKTTGRMLLRATVPENGLVSTESDLPRYDDLRPRIADDRNDENLIVSQLQVLLLKCHNVLVDSYSEGGTAEEKFNQARGWMQTLYRSIIRNDFLPAILHPKILSQLATTRSWKKLFEVTKSNIGIPIEFSAAAFRFGHSMVRASYTLNDHHGLTALTLASLFRETGKGHFGGYDGLRERFVVDWNHYFQKEGMPSIKNKARLIDPYISILLPTTAGLETSLSTRNLLRGNEIGLPSAQAFFGQMEREHQGLMQGMGIDLMLPNEIDSFNILTDIAQEEPHPFCSHTPLFYYFLAEAAQHSSGKTLGKLGSLVVGCVLLALLDHAKNELDSFPINPKNDDFFTMRDMIELANKQKV